MTTTSAAAAAAATEGVHDFGPEAYFRDPAPAPSLTSRGIRMLLPPECPAVFAARHPRLSRWPQRLHRPAPPPHSFADVVRMLVLCRELELEVMPASAHDFRSSAVQALKKRAQADGKVAVLRSDYDEARVVADEAMLGLKERLGKWPLPLRDATLMWRRGVLSPSGPLGEIWCRTRVDAMDPGSGELLSVIAAPSVRSDVLSKRIADEACDIHAVWAIAGASAVLRRPINFRFVAVQTEPPYLVRVLRMSDDWMASARNGVEKAVRVFAQCLAAGEWPDYDTAATASVGTAATTAEAELVAPLYLRQLHD